MSGSDAQQRLPTFLIAVPLAALLAVICGAVCIALAFGGTAGCGAQATGTVKGVPFRLIPIYQRASVRYELGVKGPSILAAINRIETGFGEITSDSSAGAQGWMQFMPETWTAYGVDASGDGAKDPDDPWDAIFAAARYLRASGAPGDWRAAIFAYNHADWYVEDVLAYAERYEGAGTALIGGGQGCSAAAAGPAVPRMIEEAHRLDALRLTYVYGGSHGESPTPPNGPFDCSSAVSHLLQVAGFAIPTMDTTLLIGWGERGPGRWVTIHVKPYGADAHTFIEFAPGVAPHQHRYWGTSRTNPNGGPGWIPESQFSANYLAGFEPRHPPGL